MELIPLATCPRIPSVGEGQAVVPAVMSAIIVSIKNSSITGLSTQTPHSV